MTDALAPVTIDRHPFLGVIPCTRSWYDCGNGYGVSVLSSPDSSQYEVKAGLWMDRNIRRARWCGSLFIMALMLFGGFRWFRLLEPLSSAATILRTTDQHVLVGSAAEVAALVRHVAGLPPLGSVEPPRQLLPACGCRSCTKTKETP